MKFYVIFLIGFGLICAIVSHCVRVGKGNEIKSNNTDVAKTGENSEFMAKLKSVAKTPEEADMAKSAEEMREANRDAEKMLYYIKKDIIKKAENAEYDSSAKIVVFGEIPSEYFGHERPLHAELSSKFVITNERKFDYLISALKRLSALDGIKAEKVVVKNNSYIDDFEVDFPCEIVESIGYSYYVAVKCSCTIPQSTFDE